MRLNTGQANKGLGTKGSEAHVHSRGFSRVQAVEPALKRGGHAVWHSRRGSAQRKQQRRAWEAAARLPHGELPRPVHTYRGQPHGGRGRRVEQGVVR